MAIIIRELVVRATVRAEGQPAAEPENRGQGARLSPREMERVVAAVLDALRARRER